MYDSLKPQLEAELQQIREGGLWKDERVLASPQGPVVKLTDGREVLVFCTNKYLGLSSHPEVIAAAHRALDSHGYGLSSSIYTHDVNLAFRAIRDLEAGITYVNGATIGAEAHLPFGGVKQTGNGHREGGSTVLDIFSEWKTVFVDFSGKLQKAQIDIDQ